MRSLFGAILFALCLNVFAAPSLSPEAMRYCEARGKLAVDIAVALQEGYEPDKINVTWAQPPANEDEEKHRQAWWEQLKFEVLHILPTVKPGDKFPERLGAAVAERCGLELLDKAKADGESHVLNERGAFRRTASSESITPEARKVLCRDALGAHYGVAYWAFNGMDANTLHARIETRQDVAPSERSRIHGLVDELFNSGMNPQEWLDAKVEACLHGQ